MNATRVARTAFVGLLSAGIAVLIGISSAPSSHAAPATLATGASVSMPNENHGGPDWDVTWGQK
ncbi:hypothetical protein ACFYS8_02655 [Kitasatospora sp. NPDC004615]|uniref:hypothetical protein n=1 Tax=Kitasatospora sp. NPDC004615 TaxID=3364017 RepID=UPI00368551B4